MPWDAWALTTLKSPVNERFAVMLKPNKTILGACALLGLTLLGLGAMGPWQDLNNEPLPEQPSVALGVQGLLFARPFVLEKSYRHNWRLERPQVKSGLLLVLEVDEVFSVPRNTLESVLYIGDEVAERLNWGTGSGRVVAICPAALGADGLPALDLLSALMWYGSPELPERVDAARVQSEWAAASAAGLVPLASEQLQIAREAGGALLQLADRTALEREAARLVLRFASPERDLAEGFLTPLVR